MQLKYLIARLNSNVVLRIFGKWFSLFDMRFEIDIRDEIIVNYNNWFELNIPEHIFISLNNSVPQTYYTIFRFFRKNERLPIVLCVKYLENSNFKNNIIGTN